MLTQDPNIFNQYCRKNVFCLDIRLPSLEISSDLSRKIISKPRAEWGRGSDEISFGDILREYRGVNSGLAGTGESALSLDLSRFADGGHPERKYSRSERIVCEGDIALDSKSKSCLESMPVVLPKLEGVAQIEDQLSPLLPHVLDSTNNEFSGNVVNPNKITIPRPSLVPSLQQTSLIQVKVFVPQLNVLYNYGMLRLEEDLSAESVCNRVAMFINHDRFYLFQERFTGKSSYSEELVSGLTLLPLISNHSALSAYWPMVLRTLTNRLNMSYVRGNKVVKNGTRDLAGDVANVEIPVDFRLKTGLIESVIVVPSVVSLNAELGDIKIAPVCVGPEAASERLFDSKSTNKGGKRSAHKESRGFATCPDLKIGKADGKRSEPGFTDGQMGLDVEEKAMKKVNPTHDQPGPVLDSVKDKENSKILTTVIYQQENPEPINGESPAKIIEMDSPLKANDNQEQHAEIPSTPPNIAPSAPQQDQYPPTPIKAKVAATDSEVVQASKALKTSLLYLDLCVLFSFLDLYSKFSNLKYFKTTVDQSCVERNLMISKEWEDVKIFETIYGKIYQEQQFFRELSKKDSPFLLNGHFYYGNCEEDPGICSVVNSLQPILSQPKVAFENITCKDYYCFGIYGDVDM